MKLVSIEEVESVIEKVLDEKALEVVDVFGDLMRLEFIGAVVSTLREM